MYRGTFFILINVGKSIRGSCGRQLDAFVTVSSSTEHMTTTRSCSFSARSPGRSGETTSFWQS
eukprot:3505918-Pyramimonas_sp.AAC.1